MGGLLVWPPQIGLNAIYEHIAVEIAYQGASPLYGRSGLDVGIEAMGLREAALYEALKRSTGHTGHTITK